MSTPGLHHIALGLQIWYTYQRIVRLRAAKKCALDRGYYALREQGAAPVYSGFDRPAPCALRA